MRCSTALRRRAPLRHHRPAHLPRCARHVRRAGDAASPTIRSSGPRRSEPVARGDDGRHHPAGPRADAAVRRGDRHRADRARRRAARHAGRCRRSAITPLPISAAACACCGRAPNIAGAGARRCGKGKLTVSGNRIARFAPVNFLNPERKVVETEPGRRCLDFGDDRQSRRHRSLARRRARAARSRSRPTSCRARSTLRALADDTVAFDGGGLGRQLSVYRLPESDWSRRSRSSTR